MGLFNAKTDDNKKADSTEEAKVVVDTKADAKDAKDAKNTKGTKVVTEEKSMKDLYGSDGKAKAEKTKKSKGMAYRILVKPMVTEKATNLSAVNQYVFMVSIDANKIEVAKAIFEVYGVNPTSVNIIKSKGKKVNRGKVSGRRKDFKKAIVTLKKGESISVYEGV
jgi:large subunit ribosomal protein L23